MSVDESLERISKPVFLGSYARQSVGFSEFFHRLATVATVLKWVPERRGIIVMSS